MSHDHPLLREQSIHGNAMFPFMLHEIQTNPNSIERISCHWHDEIEILLVTCGYAEISIDGYCFPIQEGSIVFIPPNNLHSATGKQRIPFSFCAIDFHPSFLNSFVNDDIQQKYLDPVEKMEIAFPKCIIPEQEWEKNIARLLWDICTAFQKKEPTFELIIKARLLEIWSLLYPHGKRKINENRKNNDHRITMVKFIIEYIETHYNNYISLELLSKKFNISTGHLCRLFKSITKMSVVEYINFYRISKSILFLRETDWEISTIAVKTGFNNISYFNKVFRSYMHITPSQFRKINLCH